MVSSRARLVILNDTTEDKIPKHMLGSYDLLPKLVARTMTRQGRANNSAKCNARKNHMGCAAL